jgi:hypothetical protein
MTVIPLRAGRQQQIPILAAGPLGGRGRVGRQPTDGGAVNFPQGDFWGACWTEGDFATQMALPPLTTAPANWGCTPGQPAKVCGNPPSGTVVPGVDENDRSCEPAVRRPSKSPPVLREAKDLVFCPLGATGDRARRSRTSEAWILGVLL